MREYEINIIVQPEISEEGSAAILGRLDEALESTSIRLCCDDLGKRKLAYEINHFQKGHYYLLSFLDDGQAVPSLERMLRLDESVLRYLTVKVSDHVVDVEARKSEAAEREAELKRRAQERAEREAEEARSRAEAEEQRVVAEQARVEAEKEAASEAADPSEDESATAEPEAEASSADQAAEATESAEDEPAKEDQS
jgi:small subunit ribosomal protein S6